MPKFNVDEQEQLGEPIEITIAGKTYRIEKITTDLLKKVDALKDEKDLDAPIKQLAVLLSTDAKEFQGIDLRKISSVLRFITKTIESELEIKNG